jgi:hypothetical protein
MSEQDPNLGQSTGFEEPSFVDLITSLKDVVADPELKGLLEQLVTLSGQLDVPVGPAPAPLGAIGSGTKYGTALLSWLKVNAEEELEGIDAKLAAIEAEIVPPSDDDTSAGIAKLKPQLSKDPAKDAVAYTAYFAEVEAELSKAFGFNFATSGDPKAAAWRGLRLELADQTGEAALTKRYAAEAAGTAGPVGTLLEGQGLANKIRDVLVQKTGIAARLQALGDQSGNLVSFSRLTGGLRNATNLVRLVGVLTSPTATEADKARARADILKEGASIAQALLGIVVDAWPGGTNQITPITGAISATDVNAALAAAKKAQEMLRTAVDGLKGVLKVHGPTTELFKPVPISGLAISKADLDKLATFTEAGAVATRRQSNRAKALGKAGVSLVANVAAGISDLAKITDPKSAVDAGQGILGLASTGASVLGDLTKLISTSTEAAQFATRLGVAGAALGTGVACISLIESSIELANNPTSERAKWNVANAAVQVAAGIFAAAMSVVCPPAALLTLLIPDFGAIGQAVELVKLMDDFDKRGLMHEKDVLFQMHAVASLNATPLVNWFNGIYASSIEGNMRAKMDTEWYWAAYGERIENLFGSELNVEEQARHKALQAFREATKASELIHVVYEKEEFNWLGENKKLFGTATTTYTASGRLKLFDDIRRGNTMLLERHGATKDGNIDRTVLLQRNFDSNEALPAEQVIGEKEIANLKISFQLTTLDGQTFSTNAGPIVKPVTQAVSKGLSAELKLDGDNLVILQAPDTVVHSTGDSNDFYRVLDGVNYGITDDAGDDDRVIFDADADGKTLKLQASGVEMYYGSTYDDVVIGSENDDIFDSGATLHENGGGDDVITLNGGDDVASVAGHAAQVDLGDGNDAVYLYALGATINGGSGGDAVYLADAMAQAVTGGTRIGDDGKLVIEMSELQPPNGAAPWTSKMTGIESLSLSRQDDIFDVAVGTESVDAGVEGLGILDAGAGNDTLRILAGGIAAFAGEGDDSVTIGSNEIVLPTIEDVCLDTGIGNDAVTVNGDVAATIVLNGDDYVTASGQIDGSLTVEVGSGNACVEIGTADTALRFDKTDEGTVTVIDGQARAAVMAQVAFDFEEWSADDLFITMTRDEFGAAYYSIETADHKLHVDFASGDTSWTWIEVGDEAYSMSAAVNQLTQAMAVPGTAAASMGLLSLPAEAHQHIQRPAAAPVASLSV